MPLTPDLYKPKGLPYNFRILFPTYKESSSSLFPFIPGKVINGKIYPLP